ncbi:MAG: multifunctional addition/repair protein [Burkholderiales bacterium]|jgi:tRNA nucleotidyltransferase (CCA-adding enzyme)|nr:multifunctional addition/repair protein [Burkholderiales bacterium]
MYKVGGYVRDKILGIQSNDVDYVVVGANPSYMENLGYVAVGRHFPVFIDPKTQAQYALARTERKVGNGYHGFEFYAATDVTLIQDLERRDITINAIAEDENGQLIDPFNGAADILHKTIRHISSAFSEDPLRVLRVARFKAKLGFDIAKETLELMRQICEHNELEHLSTERIWDELRKSLDTRGPIDFFVVLDQVGALEHIFNEFKIIVSNSTLQKKIITDLNKAALLKYSSEEKFAIIVSNISKVYPDIANNIIKNCKLGNNYSDLAYIIHKNLATFLQLELLDPKIILQLIKTFDPIRRAKRFSQVCRVLAVTNSQQLHYLEFLKAIVNNFGQIKYNKFEGMEKSKLVAAINTVKLDIIYNIHKQFF